MRPRDTWIRIATFVAVTYAVSSIFMYIAISAGSLRAYGGLCAVGGMWSPFVGVLVTRRLFGSEHGRGLRGLGWAWGKTRYQVLSYVLPILYVFAVHAATWLAGLAGFVDAPAGTIASALLVNIAVGTLIGSSVALGEEIGWQGFLVPELAKVTSFTKTALLRGIIWSVWHYPLIIGGVYGTSTTPLWYKLVCFTIVLTGISFAFAWLRIKSGSLWTGMFLHASHNLFIQDVFPSVTLDRGTTMYFIDEFGAFSAAAAIVVAVAFWLKRGELKMPGGARHVDLQRFPTEAG